jgi:hypothetical protein
MSIAKLMAEGKRRRTKKKKKKKNPLSYPKPSSYPNLEACP